MTKPSYPTAPGFVWVPSRPEEIAAMASDVARLRAALAAVVSELGWQQAGNLPSAALLAGRAALAHPK